MFEAIRLLTAGPLVQMGARIRGAVRAGIVGAVALVTLLFAVFFGMFGAYESLALRFPPWQAGALVAGGGFLTCLFLLALASVVARPRRRVVVKPRVKVRVPPPATATATAATTDATAEVARSLGAKVGGMRPSTLDLVVGAAVAGLVASRALEGSSKKSSRGADRDGD